MLLSLHCPSRDYVLNISKLFKPYSILELLLTSGNSFSCLCYSLDI